uniref:F-box/kelch-repeat protein At3g06240-like n=1 Tax=Erigeron canadensis TaxID=72917 RepID=UPI001CB8D6E5|nr:F-box/kelch-repeat protein At3g06240-like [Erigeron canadensis]
MYSLKSRNRKNFSPFPQGLRVEGSTGGTGTFLNGALHWLGGKYKTDGQYLSSVVSFDLSTESYVKISAPPYDGKSDSDTLHDLKLGVLGEWFCVVCTYMEKHGDVWVMKEYGVTTSWVQLFSIQYPPMRSWDVFSAPLCISDDGKVLVQFGSNLVLYDPKSLSVSEIQSFEEWSNAITFVESLVSPDSH